MDRFNNILLWIFISFSFILSLALISDKNCVLLGQYFFLLGLCLMPKIRNLINNKISDILEVFEKKHNRERSFTKGIDKKIGIIKFTVFFIAFIFIVVSIPQPENSNFIQDNTIQNQEMRQNKYLENRNTKKISKALNINIIEASDIYKILVNCGVNEIYWIEKIEDITDAYYIHIENIVEPLKISLKDNKLEYVFYGTWSLYDNGKYDGKLSDYSITIDEKFALIKLSKENININLKYPQNSKYNENSWNITRIDNDYSVSCSVEATNTFGMHVTHQFFLTYKKENEKFTITSMKCDGKYLIKSQETSQKLTEKDKKAIGEINKALGL